jgi:hypothetical protein
MVESPVKYIGYLNWANLKDEEQAEISRAIVKTRNEIVIEFTVESTVYAVKLLRHKSNEYKGNFTCRYRGEITKGIVSANYYEAEGCGVLIGEWHENDETKFWWTEMDKVERFPDESP